MARNDIVCATPIPYGIVRRHQVNSGAAASIKAGEPVAKTLGNNFVAALATNKPVVATDFLVGIAVSDSTDTASLVGYVDVREIDVRDTWSIAPKVAATWNTQTLYNALVGFRVLLDLTTSTWTILAADGATSGCVVQFLNDINIYPGRVLFSFRMGTSYLV